MTKKTYEKDSMSVKRSFSVLWTLTVMQLKEKMDVAYLRSFKKTLFHVIFFVLEFVAVATICYLLFWAAKLLNIFDLNGRIPTNVLTAVVTFMLALSVIFTTGGLVQSLYLSKDNLVLLTFPATPTLVFISKLLVYFVYELRKNFLFLIPFFCAFGLIQGYPVYYFPWVIVWFVFIAAIPVLLGALISIPVLFFYQLLRKVKLVQYIVGICFFALLILAGIWVISSVPESINLTESWGATYFKIKDFLETVAKIFLPITWLTTLIVGVPEGFGVNIFTPSTLPIAAGFIGSIVLLTVACFLLSKPLFYQMASKPFEFAKKMQIKAKGNEKAPRFLSAVKKEWMVALRDGTVLSLIVQLLVIMPLAIALLNTIYKAMDTRFLGTQMTVCFNLLIVLLFMLSANIRMSTAYSKDGYAAYLNKVQPSTYGSLLFSKMTVNMAIGLLGVAVTTFVYAQYSKMEPLQLLLFGVSCYLLYIAHLFWSGEMDLMNPQYEQYATFSEQSNNPNENKSSILMFVIAFLVAIVTLLLSLEDVEQAWIKVTAISAFLALMKIVTYFLKIKVYYKEK